MKIIADAHIPFVKEYFDTSGDVHLIPGRHITAEHVKDADMLLVRSITQVNEDLLATSRIKFVGSVTAGSDHLHTSWLDKAGIRWSVAAGFNAQPVADYVVSVLAAMYKKQLCGDNQKKAAVIGVGQVGKLVAERLTLLGYSVVLCDPIRAEQENDFNHTPLQDISDLDLICLHVPLTKTGEHATYHLINKDFLRRQKPECILLNAGRGAVIDTEALLQHGEHLYWCLDVWEHEPDVDKRVLKKADIATPHIAGYSVQSKMRGTEMIYQAACDKQIIRPRKSPQLTLPRHELSFATVKPAWQDIVLGIFNPNVLTMMMQETLLHDNDSHAFDEMRHQFNYRYEFAYTTAQAEGLSVEDKVLLTRLGIAFS
jgi:erythronate-4-phosphate dehydrogenase